MDISSIIQGLLCIREAIYCVVRAIVEFLISLVLWFPRMGYADICSWIAEFFGGIGVNSKIADAMALLVSVGSSLGYWLELAAFQEGVTLILSAYALRFVIRRIPIFG